RGGRHAARADMFTRTQGQAPRPRARLEGGADLMSQLSFTARQAHWGGYAPRPLPPSPPPPQPRSKQPPQLQPQAQTQPQTPPHLQLQPQVSLEARVETLLTE